MAEQAINGDPLCFGCAAEQALMEGLFAGAFGVAGKLLGPLLGRAGRAIAQSQIGQAVKGSASRALAATKGGIARIFPPKIPNWKGPADCTNSTEGRSVGPGKEYTPAQKNRIYEANEKQNGGLLRSDEDGTILQRPKKSESGVTPPENDAQVDHKFPRSQQGENSNDNAQVLSRKQSRTKSDKIP